MIGLIIFALLAVISGAWTFVAIKFKIGPYAAYTPEEDDPAPTPVNIPLDPPKPAPMPTKQDQLYALAKSLIGEHLTLNEAVPWMVGCAEAVSTVLHRFGTPGIPPRGIEGTAALLAFLEHSPAFEEVNDYEVGNIIISATGSGNGRVRGHVGICGVTQIMSNNSENGRWGTTWSINGPASIGQNWVQYYQVYGGIPTRFFKPV